MILDSQPPMHTITTSMVIPVDQFSQSMKTAMDFSPGGSTASSCRTGEHRRCLTASRAREGSLSMLDIQVILLMVYFGFYKVIIY